MKSMVLFAALAIGGCHQSSPEIVVGEAWARATGPGMPNASIYLTIANRGTGTDSLIEVVVPRARAVGLHGTTFDGGVMRMRALPDRIDIAPGERISFAPGKTHIMASGLTAPLVAGEQVAARLRFARSGDKEILVRIEAAGTR